MFTFAYNGGNYKEYNCSVCDSSFGWSATLYFCGKKKIEIIKTFFLIVLPSALCCSTHIKKKTENILYNCSALTI